MSMVVEYTRTGQGNISSLALFVCNTPNGQTILIDGPGSSPRAPLAPFTPHNHHATVNIPMIDGVIVLKIFHPLLHCRNRPIAMDHPSVNIFEKGQFQHTNADPLTIPGPHTG